jgi:hypothetical protein
MTSCLGAPNPTLEGKYYDKSGTDLATVNSNQSCSDGHAPRTNNSRCYDCASGFVPGPGDGTCVECLPSESMVFALLIICFGFLLFFILVADRIRAAGNPKAQYQTLKRTLLTHFQMVSIIMSSDTMVRWPQSVQVVLDTVGSFLSLKTYAHHFQCALGGTITLAQMYYTHLLLSVLLPIVFLFVSGFYWFFLVPRCLVLRCTKEELIISGLSKTSYPPSDDVPGILAKISTDRQKKITIGPVKKYIATRQRVVRRRNGATSR